MTTILVNKNIYKQPSTFAAGLEEFELLTRAWPHKTIELWFAGRFQRKHEAVVRITRVTNKPEKPL